MIEVSGTGFIPLTNGSGSGRPKHNVDPVDPDSDPEHCLELGHEDPRIVDQAVYAGHQFLHLPTPIGTQLVDIKKGKI
jgi:hypothetical protein